MAPIRSAASPSRISAVTTPSRAFIDGSTAIVRGAVVSGCDFFAGYPITPASGILMSMMREIPAAGGVAIQGEDEIASIGMCIGAAMTGARAMTATSGPGISLYSENIGLAVMGEVPLVIIDVQRLGPATGGATTVAQGDVMFVRWGASGGFPVIALAPTDAIDCFELTIRAFEWAEKYRCPVFLVTDKEVATTPVTVELASLASNGPGRQEFATTGNPYRFEPPGRVSPVHPFGIGDPVRFTGSTHDEGGFITKHLPTVAALNTHLVAKVADHATDLEIVDHDEQSGSKTMVVSYGVTAGAARQAVAEARNDGYAVSSLVIKSLWPVPEAALRRALAGVERIIVPELNPGLYANEVERVAGGRPVIRLTRIDGELIAPATIREAIA